MYLHDPLGPSHNTKTRIKISYQYATGLNKVFLQLKPDHVSTACRFVDSAINVTRLSIDVNPVTLASCTKRRTVVGFVRDHASYVSDSYRR